MTALLTTPWAARTARRTRRIVRLHSVAIIVIACAMLLTSVAEYMRDILGNELSVVWIAICRAVQGLGASMYLSSNTSLITRKFPSKVPYVVGLIEVGVGLGSQLGRVVGGLLFDLGGFACPFYVIAICQATFGLIGLGLEDEEKEVVAINSNQDEELRPDSVGLPLMTLLTPLVCIGGFGPFMHYFIGGCFDATGVQYLMKHLYPVSVSTLSVFLSLRGMTYLIGSYVAAQLMHRELVSFERLICFGAVSACVGQFIMGPQPVVTTLESELSSRATPPTVVLWGTEMLSMIFAMIGGSLIFVASLPLMQSEVRKFGEQAVEQVSEIFVTSLTLGEMLGPISGGWIVSAVGFVNGSLLLSVLCIIYAALALIFYDPTAVRARRRSRHDTQLLGDVADGAQAGESERVCGASCAPRCAQVGISDGEASFAFRRIPFALGVKRAEFERSRSAPVSPCGPRGGALKPWDSAPSENFRRPYVPGKR
eukprot:TRINITY_DN39062_c0_g1_i1.p1 TRINITY_DN39062_c0_g1~~TRINITY_DN39062_c0_g1_i1.p1  ORF type:complete len:554 (+),score=41.03 TRINITY_DN39062_c0_g1_i1:217-1662(+)